MEMLGIQIVGILFGLIFLYFTYLQLKRSILNSYEAWIWGIIWCGLIAISAAPSILNYLVKDVLSMSRTMDFLIIIASLIIFAITYYMFIVTKKTKNKVEQLVRALALEKNEKRNNKK